MMLFAYFYGPPGGSLDKAARHIFKQHGGRLIGAGTVMVGANAGERDVQYDVPDAMTPSCCDALRKAGFRLQSDDS